MYPKLEHKLKEKKWKTEDLAEVLKTSYWKAYYRRNGKTPFSPLEKDLLSKLMKVPEEELFMEV